MGTRYELWQDRHGEHRWRFKGANGEIVASGEGYVHLADCERAVSLLKTSGAASVDYVPPLQPPHHRGMFGLGRR